MDVQSDVAIVGGGLAGCLTALKLAAAKPSLRIVLVEATGRLGGHQTWCFHESDLAPSTTAMSWLQPLIVKSWDETSVRFPRFEKKLSGRFHAIRSERLHARVMEVLGGDVRLETKATRLSESHVELENGDVIAARCVIDARGLSPEPVAGLVMGHLKFIGQDLELEKPHGLNGPVLMDATCPQLDGFRFFFLVPWDETRLFAAETFYSDSPELNPERIRRSIQAYLERRGWKATKTEREERAVLPIPMTSEYLTTSVGGQPLPIGHRGGYFHATTGFSLPDSVKIAEFISTLDDTTTTAAREGLHRFRRPWLARQRFYRLLNRFLFFASEPFQRYQFMQHFFEQPKEIIERFYAGRTTWSDRLRILSGGPTLSFELAVRSLTEKSIQARATTRATPPPAPPPEPKRERPAKPPIAAKRAAKKKEEPSAET